MASTIEEYLDGLRSALAGADPALVQDAVYDAEEYLRSEDGNGTDEEALARAIESYGTPEEVAASYTEAELTVARAMAPPPPAPSGSPMGRFFGVVVDPRTYGALFYALLALATGVTYFTLAVIGVSVSIGLAIFWIGIPLMLAGLAMIRAVSFIEGRMVEALLGVRMPRRPRTVLREGTVFERVKWWLRDRRTWTSLLYMLLQLPVGIFYFTVVVTWFAIDVALVFMPIVSVVWEVPIAYSGEYAYILQPWAVPFLVAAGFFGILLLLHASRGMGRAHGAYAKAMLVGDLERT